MYTWISSRLAAALATVLLVSGCVAAPEGKSPRLGVSRTASDTVAVAGKSIVIGAPQGYCVDRRGSRLTGDTPFVLLASCASLMPDAELMLPVVPALLTASVARQTDAAPATDAALDQLIRFISSPDGRATLARDGQAGSVRILESRREAGAVVVRMRDQSTDITPGLEQTYWRGFFDLNGRLITISVVGFANWPLSEENGLALLRAFLTRIRKETVAQSATVAPLRRKRPFPGLFN